jgi:hypothetical protein
MELRQVRYFVRVVELGSMGRAAADLTGFAEAVRREGLVRSAAPAQSSRTNTR